MPFKIISGSVFQRAEQVFVHLNEQIGIALADERAKRLPSVEVSVDGIDKDAAALVVTAFEGFGQPPHGRFEVYREEPGRIVLTFFFR